MAALVLCFSELDVVQAEPEQPTDEAGDLVGRGGDGFWGADREERKEHRRAQASHAPANP
jgi:hypothetical protein